MLKTFFSLPKNVAPTGIAVDPARGRLYISDGTSGAILIYRSDGVQIGHWGAPERAIGRLAALEVIGVDRAGRVYVCDAAARPRMAVFSAAGRFERGFTLDPRTVGSGNLRSVGQAAWGCGRPSVTEDGSVYAACTRATLAVFRSQVECFLCTLSGDGGQMRRQIVLPLLAINNEAELLGVGISPNATLVAVHFRENVLEKVVVNGQERVLLVNRQGQRVELGLELPKDDVGWPAGCAVDNKGTVYLLRQQTQREGLGHSFYSQGRNALYVYPNQHNARVVRHYNDGIDMRPSAVYPLDTPAGGIAVMPNGGCYVVTQRTVLRVTA